MKIFDKMIKASPVVLFIGGMMNIIDVLTNWLSMIIINIMN